MKKFLALIFTVLIAISVVGCKSSKSTPDISSDQKMFTQSMTIVTMPSPPKCKTVNDMTTIDEVLEILSQIKKGKQLTDTNGGWYYMIKLNIDGTKLNYSVGGVFTDADGKQYEVLNVDEIKEKLATIYSEIDAPEKDYP